MQRHYTILLFALLSCVTAVSQTVKVDSLLSVFDNNPSIVTANSIFDILNQEEITEEPVQLTAKTPRDTMRLQVWYWVAEYYLAHQNYERGTFYGKKALPLFKASKNSVGEGDCLSLLAICYHRLGEFDDAIVYARQCNELDMKAGDPDNISSSLNLLAAIFTSSRQYEEAEKCILKALDYSRRAHNPQRLAILTGMACEIYYNMGRYEEALDYGKKALVMEQQLGRKDKIAIRQSQMAEALMGLERNDEALELLEEAIPELRASGNRHSLGIACNQMGRIMLQDDKEEEAVKYFNEALQIFIEQKDIFNESRSRKGLYQALRNSDPALAMQHNDRYNQLRDSIFDTNTGMLLSEYAAQYGNIDLQDKNDKLQKDRRLILITVASVLVLLGLTTWLFVRRKLRHQRKHIASLMNDIQNLTQRYNELQTQSGSHEPDPDHLAGQKTDDRQFLIGVIKAIHTEMPNGQVSVDDIANRLNLSTSSFRRRIQQLTGETPKAYINAVQMQKAAELLATTQLSVNAIAHECGFTEMSNFTRAFKRIYGVVPTQYVK